MVTDKSLVTIIIPVLSKAVGVFRQVRILESVSGTRPLFSNQQCPCSTAICIRIAETVACPLKTDCSAF